MSMSRRASTIRRSNSFLNTIHQGFNQFEEVSFRTISAPKRRSSRISRVKTSPGGNQIQQILKNKRQQCMQIKQELKRQREIQLVDFVKKSLRYQELLSINDNKRKRLPTLNSKIGQVVKVAVNASHNVNISYSLQTKMLPLHFSTPATRQGHTTIIFHHTAIVIGGHCSAPYATGHVYSFTSNSWKHFTVPIPRSYHSTITYKDKYAITFGGMGTYDVSRKCRMCYNSVSLIDLNTLTTRQLKMTGEELVEARKSHACTLMGKYMLVFGGINTRRAYLKDFLYLDLKELRWYLKEYQIDSRELSQEMEKGLAKHKAITHFRQHRKTLPLYSAEYSDTEGIYFFGGTFGGGTDNILLLMSLNSYNPCLRRVPFAGLPPSSNNTSAEKIDENLVVIVSGDIDARGIRLYKIKERQFIGIYNFSSSPYLGGMGSTLNKYQDGLILLFGLSQGGYNSEVVTLHIQAHQTTKENEQQRQGSDMHINWKIWDQLSISDSSNNN